METKWLKKKQQADRETRKSYAEHLNEPEWKARAREIRKRDAYTCQLCGATDVLIEVHHRSYVSGRKPWEYEDAALVSVCRPCHETETFGRDSAEHYLLQTLRENGFCTEDLVELSTAFRRLGLFQNTPDRAALATGVWLSFADEAEKRRLRRIGRDGLPPSSV